MVVDPSHLGGTTVGCGGGDSSTERETPETYLRRGRLVYGGGDSSTEKETRETRVQNISLDSGTKLLKVVRSCNLSYTKLLKVVCS
jgi:hypothetical protein